MIHRHLNLNHGAKPKHQSRSSSSKPSPIHPRAVHKEVHAEKKRQREEQLEEVGSLRQASVGSSCRARYQECWERLISHCGRKLNSKTPAGTVDQKVSGFLDQMFANGEDLSQGQYMVAATMFMLPHLRSPKYTLMPLTKQSLQGWRKLDPPKSRLPMPWEVTCFMAQEAFAMGKLQEALMMLFCFALYLRPGEVSKLRIMDLVPPVPRANQSSCHWSVVLHPLEVGVPSKTAEFDETVSFDLPDLDFIPRETSRLMKVRFRNRAEPLFSATGSQLRSVMEAIASKHGLQQIGPPHPYRLRHGGASHDFARQRRSLVEIQRRGRWKSFSSVRRYEKGGRIDQMLNSLPKPLLDRILLAAKNIQRTVQSQR